MTRSDAEIEHEKRLAAEASAELVRDGMTVGLGTGSTVAFLIAPLAARRLSIRCVATSPETASEARALGLELVEFIGPDAPAHLDLAIDGADQVDPSGWLIKGGGGAHTREKAVVAAAARFVVIVSSNKVVERLSPPVPLELAQFGLAGTIERLGQVRIRDVALSPDGGVIADYLGAFDDPRLLAAELSAATGVVEHGLFGPEMVSEVIVGDGNDARTIEIDL